MNTASKSIYLAFAVFTFLSLALFPKAQAVVPAPDGGYPGGNTAEGQNALFSLTTGGYNTAVGYLSLRSDATGSFNTGVGAGALLVNTGDQNTAIGVAAGLNLTTGNSNICIGSGVTGAAGENNTIRIGDNLPIQPQSSCYIGGIHNQSVDYATSAPVLIDGYQKLGTMASSRRFKKDIEPMDKASEGILALKPVTFHYKGDIKSTPCFGLIAEEVAQVNRDLVVRDKEGKPYTVRYDQVNAMLLNEFLKEHKTVEAQHSKIEKQQAAVSQQNQKIQEQGATITQLKQGMQTLTTQLKEQAAQLANVNARLDATRPAPQMALNP